MCILSMHTAFYIKNKIKIANSCIARLLYPYYTFPVIYRVSTRGDVLAHLRAISTALCSVVGLCSESLVDVLCSLRAVHSGPKFWFLCVTLCRAHPLAAPAEITSQPLHAHTSSPPCCRRGPGGFCFSTQRQSTGVPDRCPSQQPPRPLHEAAVVGTCGFPGEQA